MSTPEIKKWLKAASVAHKAGEKEKVRTILAQVLAVDERNEQGWLLLSQTVRAREDRQLCLENVLAINPDSQLAQQELRKLGIFLDENGPWEGETAVIIPPSPTPKKIVRKERKPLSPAAAILYPERQVTEWEWIDPTPHHEVNTVEYAADTQYDDVWSQNINICAYCATPVTATDEKCPICKNKLIVHRFKYANPSISLHIFWVMLLGIAQISLLQLIINIIATGSAVGAILNIILIVTFSLLALGVYHRQFYAFVATQYVLVVIIVGAVVQALLPVEAITNFLPNLAPSIINFLTEAINGFRLFLQALRVAGAGIALFYAYMRVGSDFARTRFHQYATIGKGLKLAADYHINAKRAVKAGMWATAVLHWQRAAAYEPTQLQYQRHLAKAYSQLRFYRRTIDILQAVRTRTTHSKTQVELDQLIQTAQQHLKEAAS